MNYKLQNLFLGFQKIQQHFLQPVIMTFLEFVGGATMVVAGVAVFWVVGVYAFAIATMSNSGVATKSCAGCEKNFYDERKPWACRSCCERNPELQGEEKEF
jgi:hypothetical protein